MCIASASSVPFRWPGFEWVLIEQIPISRLFWYIKYPLEICPNGLGKHYLENAQAPTVHSVINHDRSESRARPVAPIGSQNHEQQTMTLGCEVEAKLSAESRFSPDDITHFGDSNDRATIAQFSSRICSYFDNYMQRHGKTGRMRIKGDPRYGSGYSLAL